MLLLNLGRVIGQRIQYLMEVTGGFVQPVHCILEFIHTHFIRRQS